MKDNGGQAVGTSGNAFRFVDSDSLWEAKHKLLCAHPEVFYSLDGGWSKHGQEMSRAVTAKTVVIKTVTEKSWLLKEDPQFFKY
ncbi:unnamed protein product [Meloidogyne enterolobii]|uniref:Uncharacterized protein n=1 Tax=Meloidogyne enterolobii TaxID=390850 RepID=A0ACB0XNA7_MELEN